MNFDNLNNVKELKIILDNPKTSKMVIHNSNLNNVKINVESKNYQTLKEQTVNQIRHDELLMVVLLL